MVRLIYVSSATKDMSEEDLIKLLEQSREKNKIKNLTGMLLYAGGNFFQVLEGSKSDVDGLYSVIIQDERHTDCVLIDESDIEERAFGNWSMGFRHLTIKDAKELEGYSEFLNKKMRPEEIVLKSDSIIGLLYNFKQNI